MAFYVIAAIGIFVVMWLLVPKRRLRSWGSLAERPKQNKTGFQLPKIGFLDARKFTEEARRIGLDLPGTLYLYGSMLLGALIGAIFQTPLTTIVGGFSGAFIVWIWLQGQRERYQEKIEAQTEQMIQTVAIVYGLNRNLAQALEEAYRDADEPLKGMLGRFVQEYRAGRPLKECLEEMEKQLPVAGFKMFSSVLQVVERSGGDAAETMKNVADIVNKNRFLRQELKSELASVKQENRINVALGLLILIIFRFMITDQYMMLANNILGQILIGGMLTYMVYSIYQVNKLTRI